MSTPLGTGVKEVVVTRRDDETTTGEPRMAHIVTADGDAAGKDVGANLRHSARGALRRGVRPPARSDPATDVRYLQGHLRDLPRLQRGASRHSGLLIATTSAPSAPVLLGIDVGTSSMRAGLVVQQGREVGSAAVATPFASRDGEVEIEVETFCGSLRDVLVALG